MIAMHHRTRFITSLLALSSATLVVGCGERSDQPDQIAKISSDFTNALRSRPTVRENADTPDDSAKGLRPLVLAPAVGHANRDMAVAVAVAVRLAAVLVQGQLDFEIVLVIAQIDQGEVVEIEIIVSWNPEDPFYSICF